MVSSLDLIIATVTRLGHFAYEELQENHLVQLKNDLTTQSPDGLHRSAILKVH